MSAHKCYLGDGVYVDVDGYGGMVLTTEDGIRATNEIFLESNVYHALLQWVEHMKRQAASEAVSESPQQ